MDDCFILPKLFYSQQKLWYCKNPENSHIRKHCYYNPNIWTIWAASWQNQQNYLCAQQRLRSAWHLPSLIRVFAVRTKKHLVLSYPLSTQRRLWSDWAIAQAILSLRCAHRSFCWFCHAVAHMVLPKSNASVRCWWNGKHCWPWSVWFGSTFFSPDLSVPKIGWLW